MNAEILKSLESIIDSCIDERPLPLIKGNSIRIKHIVVRKSSKGWLVYNAESNRQVARLFSKAAALALAKSISEGKYRRAMILDLDKIVEKNYYDCLYYKNTLAHTTDEEKRAIIHSRYDISFAQTQRAKQSLDSIIFGY